VFVRDPPSPSRRLATRVYGLLSSSQQTTKGQSRGFSPPDKYNARRGCAECELGRGRRGRGSEALPELPGVKLGSGRHEAL